MKLVCNKSKLLSGVQIVSKAVPNKTTMSILECILIDATGKDIKLIANDMELGIETIIEGTIAEKGQIALEAKILLDIVRKLPDSIITIESDKSFKTIITCEKDTCTPHEPAPNKCLLNGPERMGAEGAQLTLC